MLCFSSLLPAAFAPSVSAIPASFHALLTAVSFQIPPTSLASHSFFLTPLNSLTLERCALNPHGSLGLCLQAGVWVSLCAHGALLLMAGTQ